MLLTEKIVIKPSFKDISWYEAKGYEIPRYYSKKHKKDLIRRGTTIEVYTKDLTIGSHAIVEVICDYCGCHRSISYREYIKTHDKELGDCCVKCRTIKIKHTMIKNYGVDNGTHLPWCLEKTKETNRQRYGSDWGMQSTIVKEKAKQTMLNKYGVEKPLQHETTLEKMMATRCLNLSNPTSKPQLALFNILSVNYEHSYLEVPCGRCSLDCVIELNGYKIDVEYDGWFWHQDTNRDRRRDNFVQSQGYKVLRIKGNKKDSLPDIATINQHIDKLLNGFNYTEIKM